MMNILDIQDKLKSLSQDQLANEMQMPSGAVPQFLVLGELNRRQSMRQSMQQQGAGAQTVAQELLNGAGVPSEGMSEMGRSMAPKSSIAQNTGIGSLPQQAPPPEQGGIAALVPEQATGMNKGGRVKHYQKPEDDNKSKGSERDRTERNFQAMYGIDDKPVKSADYEVMKWIANALNPVENAKSAYSDARSGDIVGAGLNAASIIPVGSGLSLLARMGMQAGPSIYDDMRGNNATGMFAGGPVMKMAAGRTPPSGNWYDVILDLLGGTSDEEMRQIEASRYGDARAKIHDENGKVVPDPEAEDRSWFNPAPAPQRSGPTPLSVFNRQEEQRKAAAAATEPPSGAATTGASGSGSGSGSGPMSSYEKMLQDAMANAEKKAKQDKWLALAQAGMSLMSSTSGSFAGALGEAGKVGIESLQGSRDVAEQNKLNLGKEMFGIEQARAAQARAAAASGRKRELTSSDLMAQLDKVQKFIDTIDPPPDGISEPIPLGPAEQASVDEAKAYRDSLIQEISRMGIGAADLSDPAQ